MNDEGKAQAQRLADRFGGLRLDAVYSSPLERARETAEAIARGAMLEVKQSAAFNEVDFGERGDNRRNRINNFRKKIKSDEL